MNADDVLVYNGAPSITASVSVTITAALPLSYMPTSSLVIVTVPSTGIGRWSVTACWPWTSSAGLNVPMSRIADPLPHPITTGNVGNTCWSMPLVFSVVNASSCSPAPMPTA